MLIGSHVSLKGKPMLLGSAEEAASYQAKVFMVYTGAPQNTKRRPLDEFQIPEAHAYMESHGIETLTVHAPYIVNLANTTKPGYHEFACEFLQTEIQRTAALGANQITLHPGAHVGAGFEVGIQQIIHGLNEIIDPKLDVQIALETMAGKGTEIGRNFEQLAQIIEGVTHNEHLSVTFDTCHVFDSGYDLVNQRDEVLTEFDRIVGLDRIKVLHINDSKNTLGSHKDRHANIGQGNIGFEALSDIVHLPEFAQVPKILETPWVPIDEDGKKKVAPYRYEINMLTRNQLNPHLMDDIINQVEI